MMPCSLGLKLRVAGEEWAIECGREGERNGIGKQVAKVDRKRAASSS